MSGHDPALPIPDLPASRRALGSFGSGLQRTATLDADPPFVLDGPGVRVTGGHRSGVETVAGPERVLARGIHLGGAVARRSTLSPVGLERRLKVDGAEVVERTVVSPAGPVVFLEWTASEEVTLSLTWWIPAHELRWRATDRAIVTESPDGRGVYAMARVPDRLDVERADDELRVQVRVRLAAGAEARLAVAGIRDTGQERRVLRIMGRPRVAVTARQAAVGRVLESTFRLEPADGSLAEALSWAKVGLAEADGGAGEAVAGGPGGRDVVTERILRLCLAGLAVGDSGTTRSVIRGAAGGADRENGPHGTNDDAARWLVLLARYLAWTGDPAVVKEAWGAARDRVTRCLADPARGSAALRLRALTELVVAAEEVGDRELAALVRDRAPIADGSAPELMWAAPGRHDASDPGLRSAALVEAVVHGLLGVEPDAPRGRLVLRPRLPASWTRFAFRDLAIGDSAVEMEYALAGGTHRWTLRQRRGSAPLTLILEPQVEGARVISARVDARPATLDVAPVEGRLQVPVQLVLDHERRVEVEIGGRDD